MNNVLCFGEILLRLSPDINGNWLQQQSLPVFLGGAELNVAQALAKWGVSSAYCSALPDNYMSKAIRSELQSKNIDTSRLITGGSRIGIYYLAQGSDLKNAEVIYDRAGSSTAMWQPGKVDWDTLLDGIDWFHFSAITPAIDRHLVDVCLEALAAAKKKKITISVDLNYRAKLWKWGKEPGEVMPELVEFCDLVMGNIWAAEKMLGIGLPKNFSTDKASCLHQATETSAAIIRRFPACKQVANTFRFDHGGGLNYYATLFSDQQLYVSKEHEAANIKDKVGSGDCFMAGLIYGNLERLTPQQTIDFAAAAAVDKMFIVGDATTSTVDTIKKRITV